MDEKFVFTGTGGSMGVPIIGCKCDVCLSRAQENKRMRSAGVLYANGKAIAVDMGPDFRTQCLSYGITHLDGVLITHTHADHINGIDDIRIFSFRKKGPVPCLLSQESVQDIEARFHYFLPPQSKFPHLDLQIVEEPFGEVDFIGIPLTTVSYTQATMEIMGFRYKNFAYITDIQKYSDEIFQYLQGVDTLVISALRWTPSLVHFTIDDALSFIDKVSAKKALLTHISHDLEHHNTNERLPKGVSVAYDGLEVRID